MTSASQPIPLHQGLKPKQRRSKWSTQPIVATAFVVLVLVGISFAGGNAFGQNYAKDHPALTCYGSKDYKVPADTSWTGATRAMYPDYSSASNQSYLKKAQVETARRSVHRLDVATATKNDTNPNVAKGTVLNGPNVCLDS